MLSLRCVALLLAVLAGAAAPAQLPFGRATGVAGHRPELFAEPLWLGNPGYGYRIENGPPNSSALLLVSLQRQDQSVFGLELYPSLAPGDLLLTMAGALDPGGRLFLPSPLAGPEIPVLAGLVLYAQAAIVDPAGFGSTQGLLLDLTLHPLLAVGNQTHGVVLIDLVFGTTAVVAGFPTGVGIGPAVFGNGGRDLFVATTGGLFVVDTLSPVPNAVALRPEAFVALVWDHARRRLFAADTNNSMIKLIDGDRASPSFGSVVGSFGSVVGGTVSTSADRMALTADGRELVLGTGFGHLARYAVDPAGPGYLQPIPTAPSPVQFHFIYVRPPHIAPDGSVVTIPVLELLPARSVLHRFDAALNQWIDHDPSQPGVQPLSKLVDPLLPQLFEFLPSRDGSLALLADQQVVAGLALDLGGATFSRHNLPIATMPAATYFGVTPSGRYLLAHRLAPVGSELMLVDIATGVVWPFAALTPAHWGNWGFAVWR
ncbi:MAG TPA: hypothetical protein VFT55_09295 [Planctomycetota bacterium]|nr:hypothetical protein [Planctomycetota bacterium]